MYNTSCTIIMHSSTPCTAIPVQTSHNSRALCVQASTSNVLLRSPSTLGFRDCLPCTLFNVFCLQRPVCLPTVVYRNPWWYLSPSHLSSSSPHLRYRVDASSHATPRLDVSQLEQRTEGLDGGSAYKKGSEATEPVEIN